MKVNKLEPLNLTVNCDMLFSDILDMVSEKNSVVSKRPFVNVNGGIFYNPSDKERAGAK